MYPGTDKIEFPLPLRVRQILDAIYIMIISGIATMKHRGKSVKIRRDRTLLPPSCR